MKKFMVLSASMILAGWAWAQPQGTASRKPTAKPVGSAQGPNMHAFQQELRAQMRQIHMDLKSGKMSKAEAKAAWDNLKNVKKQEIEFFRQNGQKEITADQKVQLEAVLNGNGGKL